MEAEGTVELTVKETDVIRRMDVREASPPLLSLASHAVLAALRYHRRAPASATVSLDVTRFADAAVIAAVADRAVATTLVTVDGRTLTEIALTMRNRAQPFLRVELPAGASMVSAEVAGQTAKLAQGPDGTRVPLLRPGFRPNGPYTVSFVYVQSGQPFAKKGRAELVLPKMDIPVALVEWEMFVPERYRVRRFDGNAMLEPAPVLIVSEDDQGRPRFGRWCWRSRRDRRRRQYRPVPGQIVGHVLDSAGAVLPGAIVTASLQGPATGRRRSPTAPAGSFSPMFVQAESLSPPRCQGSRRPRRLSPLRRDAQGGSTCAWKSGCFSETVTVAADAVESEEFGSKVAARRLGAGGAVAKRLQPAAPGRRRAAGAG